MTRYVNSASLEIVGVKEALRQLNKMDKVARRQLTKDYAQIVSPIIAEARELTPAKAPLSGMAYQWKGRGAKQTRPISPTTLARVIVPLSRLCRVRSLASLATM